MYLCVIVLGMIMREKDMRTGMMMLCVFFPVADAEREVFKKGPLLL